jgi:lysophospholipase L1-like esterase
MRRAEGASCRRGPSRGRDEYSRDRVRQTGLRLWAFRRATIIAATMLSTPAVALASLLAQAPASRPPEIAFPGQWAPPPAASRFPANAKGCVTRYADAADRADCLQQVAYDFPRLSRYAAANAALPAPARNEKRVIFFGDSITDNWSKPGYGGFFPGKRYINRGISAQTAAQMVLRLRADVIALAPRAVVILAGTNDLAGNNGPTTPEAIEDSLANMAELLAAHNIKVILASLPPVCDCKQSPDGRPIRRTTDRAPDAILGLNRWMVSFAKKNGHVYLDYHAALKDADGAFNPALTDDGLHPNAAGYAVMAPLAEKAIAAALGK